MKISFNIDEYLQHLYLKVRLITKIKRYFSYKMMENLSCKYTSIPYSERHIFYIMYSGKRDTKLILFSFSYF